MDIQLSRETETKLETLAKRNNKSKEEMTLFLIEREIDDFEQAKDLGDAK